MNERLPRSAPSLSIVHRQQRLTIETPAQAVARLAAETRTAADANLDAFIVALSAAAALGATIAAGDSYPPGARDIARRLAEDLTWKTQTLEAVRRSRP